MGPVRHHQQRFEVPLRTDILLVMWNGSFTIMLSVVVSRGYITTLQSREELHPKKIMRSDIKGILHYELLDKNKNNQHWSLLPKTSSFESIFGQKVSIFNQEKGRDHENVHPHARLETMLYPRYSPSFAPSDYHLFRVFNTIWVT